MTDKQLEKAAALHKEIVMIDEANNYLQNCSSFNLVSGNRICEISSGLQHAIREAVKIYCDELKRIQKEL